jgi:hypothetical protein
MRASEYLDERDQKNVREMDRGGFFEPLRRAIARRSAELDRKCDPPFIAENGSFENDARGVLMEKRGLHWILKLIEANRRA